MSKTCFLFRAHKLTKQVLEKFDSVTKEFSIDCFLVAYTGDNVAQTTNEKIFTYSVVDVIKAGLTFHSYKSKSWHWLNADYSIILFSLNHREYDFIFYYEYDCLYTGSLMQFLDRFSPYTEDLIVPFLRAKEENEHGITIDRDWSWWDTGINLNELKQFGCFACFGRGSRKAVDVVHQAYKSGKWGFSELFIPTVILNSECSFRDSTSMPEISGAIKACNLSWSPIPFLSESEKLYHPIK